MTITIRVTGIITINKCNYKGDFMLGAVIGDIIGSVYEWHNMKSLEFELFSRESRFTDDTVMTVAVTDALLNNEETKNPFIDAYRRKRQYAYKFKEYGRKYPDAGYGNMFKEWLQKNELVSQKSYGNGSAMRVSPIGYAFDKLEDAVKEAKFSTSFTHNHKDAIKGAQSVVSAVYLSRHGERKEKIKAYIEKKFGYDLNLRIDDIRPTYKFDSSCRGSVPQAIIAFLESENYEDAIRKAISIGGDSDTIACITGGIARAFYGKIPKYIIDNTNMRLDMGLKRIINLFNLKYNIEI